MFSTNNLCYDLEGLFIINICLTTIIITKEKKLYFAMDLIVRAFYVEKQNKNKKKKNNQTMKN